MGHRINGGVVGSYVNTTSTAAAGVWSMSAAAQRQARNLTQNMDIWPVAADASFASVVGLYHFNTINGGVSPTLPDSSGSALHLTPRVGTNVSIYMNSPKFGLYALNCASASSGATYASNAAYSFGTGDWTIEGWAYQTTLTGGSTYIDLNGSGGIRPTIYAWTDGTLRLYINSADRVTSATSLISLNAWVHWAATHTGTSTKLYYNGNQVGSTYTDSATYTQGSLSLGAFTNNTTGMSGYLDEVRITKGVARYTGATYTIPTAPFPDY